MLKATQLIGFGARSAPVLSLAFFDYLGHESDGIANLSLPAGAQAGDLAVASVQTFGGSLVTPSGWTLLYSNTSVREARGACKILDGTETTANFNSGSTTFTDGGVAIFRPSRVLASLSAAGWQSQGTSANPTAQTVTSGSGIAPLVVIGFAHTAAGSVTGFSTQSPAFDDVLSNNPEFFLGYKIYNSNPVNHSVDMDDGGSNNVLASGYIQTT